MSQGHPLGPLLGHDLMTVDTVVKGCEDSAKVEHKKGPKPSRRKEKPNEIGVVKVKDELQ